MSRYDQYRQFGPQYRPPAGYYPPGYMGGPQQGYPAGPPPQFQPQVQMQIQQAQMMQMRVRIDLDRKSKAMRYNLFFLSF